MGSWAGKFILGPIEQAGKHYLAVAWADHPDDLSGIAYVSSGFFKVSRKTFLATEIAGKRRDVKVEGRPGLMTMGVFELKATP